MWIWETDGYPDFTYDIKTLRPALEQLAYNRGALLSLIQLLESDDVDALQVESLVSDACSTFEIEGVILSRDSVRSSVKRRLGLEHVAQKHVDIQADNIVSVLLDAVENCDMESLEERMYGYHAALFPTGYSGFAKIRVDEYRTEEMEIVSGREGRTKVHYVAPQPSEMPEQMNGFYAWIKSCEPDAINTAIAHLWFLIIHPFDNGNGRLARVIGDMMCAKMDRTSLRLYSVSETILKNKKAYYEVLERTTDNRFTKKPDMMDVTEWVTWFVEVLDESVSRSIRSIKGIVEKKRFIEAYFQRDLNNRQRKVLLKILDYGPDFEGELTTLKYKSIAVTSRATAVRDIQELEEKGILIKNEGKGGRSTSYRLNKPQV